ncbi:hypothetical protein ACIGAN_28745 [Streptomyces sp. NPDC085931]|uniref:hypothetical protein n=1 Tax=Streptomyces sp. NPDC085931 TaxID=3365740 RepID=UPI0037D29DE6
MAAALALALARALATATATATATVTAVGRRGHGASGRCSAEPTAGVTGPGVRP